MTTKTERLLLEALSFIIQNKKGYQDEDFKEGQKIIEEIEETLSPIKQAKDYEKSF